MRTREIATVLALAGVGLGMGVLVGLGPAGAAGAALIGFALGLVVVLLDRWDRG